MIRDYKETDWDQVSAIYNLSKPDEMKGIVDADAITPLEQDSQMLRYFFESRVFVFEDNGIILGFVGIKKDVISWLFVHPQYRRKGIARRLLKKIMEIQSGSLRLNLAKSNRAAMILYKSLGFIIYEEFEGKMYGCSIPAVRMILQKEPNTEQSHHEV